MKFLTDEELESFINQHDYDIRKTGNARWIDQKCTPDSKAFIMSCLVAFHGYCGYCRYEGILDREVLG